MKTAIARPRLDRLIASRLERYPVVAVLGARQTGKTHLTKSLASGAGHHFDLENGIQLQALDDNPLTILGGLEGTVVID